MSRRLFALGAAGFAFVAPLAHATPGDELNGTWEGTLAPARGANLSNPSYGAVTIRLVIDGETARVFQPRDDGRSYEEVKPGSFQLRRLGDNAVISSIDSSPAGPLGQGWVETWTINVSLRDSNALAAVFTRQVNNMHLDNSTSGAIFSVVQSGELQRLGDHV